MSADRRETQNVIAAGRLEIMTEGGRRITNLPLWRSRPRKGNHAEGLLLSDLGLDENTSTRWQAVGRVSDARRASYGDSCLRGADEGTP